MQGSQEKGVEHAWHKTGAAVGEAAAETKHEPMAAAILDLTKAFDHIPRQLLHALLKEGGFPVNSLQAYKGNHTSWAVRFEIPGHVGTTHNIIRSIPQGYLGA